MNDISRLASYLRDNGERILNSGHKLVLNVPLLHNLNESFALIVESQENAERNNSSTFQVVSTNNSKLEIFYDLAFLHDFLQMTINLKLVSSDSRSVLNSAHVIDISKFKVLKSLEISRVPITKITGIQHFREQLRSIVCIHCLKNLDSLLVNCGADNSSGSTWSELCKADFSYNELSSLDLSLNYAPSLQVLDVSHNRLTNAEAVVCLPNLTSLNLNYNLLTSVPALHQSARLKLQTLGIKFNCVEDLTQLASVENLTHLDLSCNCLMDYNDLQHLLHLPMLMWLGLKGNPLSFHKNYRLHTAHCLHTNVSTRKFLLDLVPLSKSEKKVVGKVGSLTASQSVESLSPSIRITEVPPSPSQTTSQSPPRQQSSRRSGKVREAVISETDVAADLEPDLNSSVISSLEMSTEHLETKKLIESLRERFGEENWLHSSGGSCIQDILGLPHSNQQQLPTVGTPCSRAQYEDQANLIHQAILSDMPVQKDVVALKEAQVECSPDVARTAPDAAVSEMETSSDSLFGSRDTSSEVADDDMQIEAEDDEGEKQIYVVENVKRPGEGLFLVITKEYIKEKETVHGRTLEQWPLDSLMSAVKMLNVPVTVVLSFRTIRRDRQERSYLVDEKDAQELVGMLNEVLASQILSFIKSFCCMKCSTQFSTEVSIANIDLTSNISCPTCQSTYVIEMEEHPVPENHTNNNVEKSVKTTAIANNDMKSSLVHSASQSSIGADGSLSDGPSRLQVTAIIHSSEIQGVNQSTTVNARSAASLDPSPEGSSATGSTVPGRSDSDVEVISNPSQSSIEVLEETRRDAPATAAASQNTRTQLLSLMGLTESSSSGSFTDSVCTTYENHLYAPLPKDQVAGNPDEKIFNEESADTDMDQTDDSSDCLFSSFTSVLDDVLSTSLKIPNQLSETNGVEDRDKVQYNYFDFAQVDHRVKLHLYLHVFKDKDEELLLLIRAHLMPTTTAPYPGCVVFSNCMVYFLQVAGFEGDDPDLWLLKRDAIQISKLKTIQVLPWRQGVCLEFHDVPESSVLVLLQDIGRVTNLLNFLKDCKLPEKCLVATALSVKHKLALQHLYTSMKKSHKASPLQQLTVFTSCKVTDGCGAVISSSSFGFIFIMENIMILSKDNLHWLFPYSISKLEADHVQSVSNLIQVQINKLNLVFEFLNEASSFSSAEVWVIEVRTVDTLQQLLLAVRKLWEELFAVPLQIIENTEIQSET